jgi:hypothetical protein
MGAAGMTALRWPVAALVAAVALVGAYLALGGRNYAPAAVPNPCAPRHWHNVADFSDLENEVALSALDGAACRLHVSQPALALAFTSDSRLKEFARRHGLSTADIAAAAKAGLERAISDGQRAGTINELEGLVLHAAADRVPVDQLIRLVRGVLGG